MATVRYSSVVSDIRGSINGTTYSRNRGGAYAKVRVTPVNPRTAAQTRVRTNFRVLSQAWRALGAYYQASWAAAAPSYIIYNRLGDPTNPSGAQLYHRVNFYRLNTGLSVTATPPAVDTLPTTTFLTFVADTSGMTPVLTLSWTGVGSAGSHFQVNLTYVTSAGVTYVSRSRFKTAQYHVYNPMAAVDLYTDWSTIFGPLTTSMVGMRIFAELVPISANGYPGAPIRIYTTVV